MVLDDFLTERKPRPRAEERTLEQSLAKPIDRLAATVADLVIFLPLLALVIAPFGRRATEAQLIGNDQAWNAEVGTAIAIGLAVLIAYQTIFVSIFGGTPGKLALRLRIVTIWDRSKPRPMEAFLRSVVWALELACLGIPWLAVFSTEKRRPFHDRIADTAVVGLSRKRQGGLPGLAEMSLASGVQSAALAVLVLVVTMAITDSRRRLEQADEAATDREADGQLCSEVREAIEEIPGRHAGAIADRLETALTLFETDQLDGDCLAGEADFALWRNRDSRTLAYLAKGLSVADTVSASPYFEKACASPNATAGNTEQDICAMVALASDDEEASSDDPDEQAERRSHEVLAEQWTNSLAQRIAAGERVAPYVRIRLIRRLMAGHEYEKALTLLDSLSGSRRVGAFMAKARAKALWEMGRESEANLAMRSTMDLIDASSRVELARWFCFKETLASGCSERGKAACRMVSDAVDRFDSWLLKPEVAAAYIRGETCEGENDPHDLRALEDKIPLHDGKRFVEALALIQEGKRDEAVTELKAIIGEGESEQGPFFFEANARLAELASSSKELETVKRSWDELDPSDETWKPLGQSLIRRFTRLQAWDAALAVGLRLTHEIPGDVGTYELMVQAAQQAGNHKLAQGLLETVWRLKPAGEQRHPASLSGGGHR